ncbi:LOW QUALITY PROTEIN: ABC transporter protein [Vibrio sp. JCM 18904]|nr:LOW QUALITY PROTEIN: ABC transporter protein [Vibrio sp. JCM 18904]
MQTEHFSQKINFADKCYLTFSTVISTLFGLVLPFSILIIFDRVLPNQAKDTLFLLFAIILITIFLDYHLKNQEEKISSVIMKQFETNLTNKVFQSICLAEISKFRRLEPGEYLERIATIPEIKSFFGGESVRALINLAVSILTILIIGLINIWLGTILLASIVLAVFALSLSKQKINSLENKSDIEGLTTSKIIEIISSPLDIKARNMEYRVESLMTQMVEEREVENIKYEQIESNFNLILSLIQQLSIACVVVVLATAVINMQSSQGIMAAIIMLTNRYFAPYQQVMRTVSRWELNKLHIQRIAELLELAASVEQQNDTTEVERISVKYSEKQRIEFERGQAYLLTGGKSGAGKTHLANCITRQNTDSKLDIQINETPLDDVNYNVWRNSVLMVDKTSSFVEGTIIDNLTCFRPSLNNTAFALCETMNIKAQIDALPAGFYTELKGHLRNPFSRQVAYALLLVRALLANKRVLIFDDIDCVYDDDFARLVLTSTAYRANDKILIIVSNKMDKLNHRLKRVKLTGGDQ